MSRRTLWGAAAVALTLLLGAAALLLTPVDRTAAATAAQDSLSAVRTLARTAEARLDGRGLRTAGYSGAVGC